MATYYKQTDSQFSPDVAYINPNKIATAIASSNFKSAPGIDEMDYVICKQISEAEQSFFPSLFNLCLKIRHFPIPWKRGKIPFFHKEGKSRDRIDSCRPIVLFSSMGKFFERIVKDTDVKLKTQQHGFVEGRSKNTALAELRGIFDAHRRRHKHVIMIFIDFREASSRINYSPVIKKCKI